MIHNLEKQITRELKTIILTNNRGIERQRGKLEYIRLGENKTRNKKVAEIY